MDLSKYVHENLVCYPGFTFPPVTEQTEACDLFSDSSRLESHPVHRYVLKKTLRGYSQFL